jgi:hypothetical protein
VTINSLVSLVEESCRMALGWRLMSTSLRCDMLATHRSMPPRYFLRTIDELNCLQSPRI